MMMMGHHHQYHHNRVEAEKEAQKRQRTTERDHLAGTDDELSSLEASLAGLGCGALLASGTGVKLLRRTIMARLPESAGFACLTSTGLWQARRTAREWDVYHHLVLPWWSLYKL